MDFEHYFGFRDAPEGFYEVGAWYQWPDLEYGDSYCRITKLTDEAESYITRRRLTPGAVLRNRVLANIEKRGDGVDNITFAHYRYTQLYTTHAPMRKLSDEEAALCALRFLGV